MLDNREISNSPHPKFYKFSLILISFALITSSLTIWYMPVHAQQQDPYANAVFSFTVVFPDITITGSGFPKNDAFYVRVRGNSKDPYVKIGTIHSKADGTMFDTFTMPEEMRDQTHITVCLKNIGNDRVLCSGIGTLVFIKINACEPGAPITFMKNRSGFSGIRIKPPDETDINFFSFYEIIYRWQY